MSGDNKVWRISFLGAGGYQEYEEEWRGCGPVMRAMEMLASARIPEARYALVVVPGEPRRLYEWDAEWGWQYKATQAEHDGAELGVKGERDGRISG